MTDLRIGNGYDVHRLKEGRRMIIGGVEIPYEKGLLGHSDADVLAHAVADALLGALRQEGRISQIGDRYAMADFTVTLTKRQRNIREKM